MKVPGKNPVIDVTPKPGQQLVYYLPEVWHADIWNESVQTDEDRGKNPRFWKLVESIERDGLRIPVFGILVQNKFRTMVGKQRTEALRYLGRHVPMVIHDVHRQLPLMAAYYQETAVPILSTEEGQKYFEGEATFNMDRYVSVIKLRNWRDEVG